MSLSTQIMEHIKDAMRAKDTIALEALRAIKSEMLLALNGTVPYNIAYNKTPKLHVSQ